jgi:hypothetical protein
LSSTTDDQVVATPTSTTTYTVTAANTSGCQSVGTVTVTVATAPITVTGNSTICSGGSKALTASGGSTYIWYPSTGLYTDAGCTVAYTGGSSATVYAKPSATTTYYVNGTTAGGCSAIAGSVVTISSAPINSSTSTPINLIFCTQGTSSFPLNVVMTEAVTSATWSYSSNGTTYTSFTSATTVSGVTLTPSSSGTSPNVTYTCTLSGYGNAGYSGARYFRLTIVSSLCTYNYDIYVTDTKATNPTPSPTASKATICSGDNVTLSIGALASGSTVQWQSSSTGANNSFTDLTGATTATYTTVALSANTYYRAVFNGGTGNCGSISSSILITVNTALASNTLSPSSTCSTGSGSITITGSAISGGIYQWQGSTTSGSTDFSDILGAVNQNYTLPYNIVSTQTWFRRTATNGTCLSSTSSAVVVTPPVTGNNISTSTTSFCNGTAPSITLSGSTPTGGNGSYTYSWQSSTNGTTFNAIVGATGKDYVTSAQSQTYWYRRIVASDQCSGDNSNTIKITVNTNPTITVTASSTICSGSSKSLTASGAVSYSWSPSTYLSATTGSDVTSNPSANTTYTVTGTDGNGCSNSVTTTITVTNLPTTPTLSTNNKTICNNSSQNLNSLVTSGGTYAWYTAPEVNALYLVGAPTAVSTAGTYYVFASSSGCYSSNYASLVLTISNVSPPVVNSTSASVCSPSTVDLTSLEPVANAGTTLEWHTASSNPGAGNLYATPTTAGAGTYYLYAYSNSGVCFGAASSAVTITVNSLPTVSLNSSSTSVCEPNTVDLTSYVNTSANTTYQWYSTSTNPPVASDLLSDPTKIASSGTYYVFAFNNTTGCKSSPAQSFTVTVNVDPALSLTSPNVDCSGNSTSLVVSVTNGLSSPTYQWKITMLLPGTGITSQIPEFILAPPLIHYQFLPIQD